MVGQVQIGGAKLFQALSTRPPSFVFGENKCPVQFIIGTPVARHPSGSGFLPASCSGVALRAVGLACVGAKVGFEETCQIHGSFSAPDWMPLVGTPTLTPMNTYFLSAGGVLSDIAPSVPGQIVQQMGHAIDAETLLIDIGPVIRL